MFSRPSLEDDMHAEKHPCRLIESTVRKPARVAGIFAAHFYINRKSGDTMNSSAMYQPDLFIGKLRRILMTKRPVIAFVACCLVSGAALAQGKPVVQFIATGGTIAMKIDPVTKGVVPAISGDDLMKTVPDAARFATIEVNNFSNMSANYVEPQWWSRLTKAVDDALARPEVAGVVVSQGTDTMEETAYWLDLTVKSDKPVVLIGAQRNASESDFDGPRNLLNAVRICVDPQSKGKGAMLAMNNQINAARDVTKTHTSSVETFKSGDFGVLGIVDYDRVVFSRTPLRRQYVPIKTDVMPYVEIVAMYGGADGYLIKAALDHGAKGLVVEGLGWGNVNKPMYAAIEDAIAKGVPIVITSRVTNGRVLPNYGWEGGGK